MAGKKSSGRGTRSNPGKVTSPEFGRPNEFGVAKHSTFGKSMDQLLQPKKEMGKGGKTIKHQKRMG